MEPAVEQREHVSPTAWAMIVHWSPQWSTPLNGVSTGDEAGELILKLRAAMGPAALNGMSM
jgi:hypothetical protein